MADTYIPMPADVRLEGPGGTFMFIQETWENALRMAMKHGWQPEHKPSVYVADVGLDVSAADANALADGVEGFAEWATQSASPLWGMDEVDAARWREFAAYCRAGAFRVMTCPGRPID